MILILRSLKKIQKDFGSDCMGYYRITLPGPQQDRHRTLKVPYESYYNRTLLRILGRLSVPKITQTRASSYTQG